MYYMCKLIYRDWIFYLSTVNSIVRSFNQMFEMKFHAYVNRSEVSRQFIGFCIYAYNSRKIFPASRILVSPLKNCCAGARGVTLSEKSVANGSHHYAALLVTCWVIAIYIVERSEPSKFVSGAFYFVNKDL